MASSARRRWTNATRLSLTTVTLPSPVVEIGRRYPLQFWKYPATVHWRHDAIALGEDDFGLWLGAREGWEAQKGLEPARPIAGNQIHLVPHDDWFVYTYSPSHPRALHWIDTSTPATFEDHRVTAVDLDLDVVRSPDGLVWIEDQDEFELHQVTLDYPPEFITKAAAATDRLYRSLVELREPFKTVARSWVQQL